MYTLNLTCQSRSSSQVLSLQGKPDLTRPVPKSDVCCVGLCAVFYEHALGALSRPKDWVLIFWPQVLAGSRVRSFGAVLGRGGLGVRVSGADFVVLCSISECPQFRAQGFSRGPGSSWLFVCCSDGYSHFGADMLRKVAQPRYAGSTGTASDGRPWDCVYQ